MDVPQEAMLLRIYLNSGDRHGLDSLYVAIVKAARHDGLAGATVLKGPMGFGHSRKMHHEHLVPFGEDHPVVVEIVDSAEKIEGFLPKLDEMMQSGLVTLERARVLHYGRPRKGLLARFRAHFGHEEDADKPVG